MRGTALAVVAWLALAWTAAAARAPGSLEQAGLLALAGARSERWTTAMLAITATPAPLAAALVLASLAVLVRRQRWRDLGPLALLGLGVWGCALLAKYALRLGRPAELALVSGHGYGFPSGHTAAAAASVVVLLFALRRGGLPRPARAVAAALGASWVAAVAFSRLYLGAHYPSDVLASLALVAAWAAPCGALLAAARPAPGLPAAFNPG